MNDNQLIQMVQRPAEENEEVDDVKNDEISRAEKFKSLSIVISLFDLSKDKDLDHYRQIKRIQREVKCTPSTQISLDRWLTQINFHKTLLRIPLFFNKFSTIISY